MSTTAIILAAEPGEEFSGSKYLAPVHGELMLQTVVNDAFSWAVDDVVVVLGADADEIIAAIDFKGMTVVIDPGWSEGASSPIRAALDLASRDRSIRRCIMTRGDQPGVGSEIAGALVAAAVEGEADSVLPKYRYAVGWPIVLDLSLWEQLLGSEGHLDLLDFVVSHASALEEVWFDSLPPAVYATPQDLP
jgi:molybdenum cofactor cytidylyltransferase